MKHFPIMPSEKISSTSIPDVSNVSIERIISVDESDIPPVQRKKMYIEHDYNCDSNSDVSNDNGNIKILPHY